MVEITLRKSSLSLTLRSKASSGKLGKTSQVPSAATAGAAAGAACSWGVRLGGGGYTKGFGGEGYEVGLGDGDKRVGVKEEG